jgi:hypothetical protein
MGGRILAIENMSCTPVLSGVPAYDDNAHSGTLSVTDNSGCSWTASGLPAWVTITSGGSGTGNGTISYTVAANTTGADRSATFTVAGPMFSITQYTPMRFVPVTPCRVFDTRNANGPFGGPSIAAGTARSFAIPNSACGIPATALAYSVNVTVIPPAALAYLTVWPTGQPQPTVSLMSSDGRIKANAAIVAAGSGGAISVYATNQTDATLDIAGYFVSSTTAGSLAYYPVTPCRLVDTRHANGPLAGPELSAGQSRTFPLLSGSCGIPSAAQAYSLNVTAIPPAGLAYLTVWPAGQSQPVVSTLNDATGTVVANAAVVPAGSQRIDRSLRLERDQSGDRYRRVLRCAGHGRPVAVCRGALPRAGHAPAAGLAAILGTTERERGRQRLSAAGQRRRLCAQRHGDPLGGVCLPHAVGTRAIAAGRFHAERFGWDGHLEHGAGAGDQRFRQRLCVQPDTTGSRYGRLFCAVSCGTRKQSPPVLISYTLIL